MTQKQTAQSSISQQKVENVTGQGMVQEQYGKYLHSYLKTNTSHNSQVPKYTFFKTITKDWKSRNYYEMGH